MQEVEKTSSVMKIQVAKYYKGDYGAFARRFAKKTNLDDATKSKNRTLCKKDRLYPIQ